MNKRSVCAMVILVVATLAGMMPSRAASDVVYVSGPGEAYRGYTEPVFVIQAGTPVDYINLDITAHNVEADAYGPDRPWCVTAGFSKGKCPLFSSPQGQGSTQRAAITDIDLLAKGTYTFHCYQHPVQKGTLVVL